jgi:[ribosomal protein S5]-alanine N-acetyltransferase
MQIIIETKRLLLRELNSADDKGMFELDSNPEVHRYLGNNPVMSITECRKIIEFVREQYISNGIGRWAVIEKESGAFTGWCGLKLVKEEMNNHINYYDIGYRFIQKYWGKGYATEAAIPCCNYGFDKLKLNALYGTAHVNNIASQTVLQKCGLKFIENFYLDGEETAWFKRSM